jgi:hypothetical protein
MRPGGQRSVDGHFDTPHPTHTHTHPSKKYLFYFPFNIDLQLLHVFEVTFLNNFLVIY